MDRAPEPPAPSRRRMVSPDLPCPAHAAALSTPGDPVFVGLQIDFQVLAFMAAVGIGTCLLFGFLPALRATRIAPSSAMRAGGRGITTGRERFSLRRALVVAQVAMSLVLLAGAMLFVRSLQKLLAVDPGFRPEGIVAVSGDAAVRMARRFRPTGILLDIQLPVKNGWQVMEELKKDAQTRSIPVHIISSFEAKSESILMGAIDFMSKPMAFENMDQVFERIEYFMNRSAKKVLIVEDNGRHAKALAYFLGAHNVNMEIAGNIAASVELMRKDEVYGVILSREPGKEELDTLEMIRQNPELTDIPIIVFTGMNISKAEEARLRQYADSIVVKTAHSYQRVLDEVSLFLHIVGDGGNGDNGHSVSKLGVLEEVLKNKTVLVADDDVRNIFSLTKALEQHKVKVITAMDGKEALALAEDNAVDIVLMDMMMPEMDGYEAISRIRSNPRTKRVPIIAVTAKAMAGDREKCIRAGASDYITKPVDVDQLISLLRIWVYEK